MPLLIVKFVAILFRAKKRCVFIFYIYIYILILIFDFFHNFQDNIDITLQWLISHSKGGGTANSGNQIIKEKKFIDFFTNSFSHVLSNETLVKNSQNLYNSSKVVLFFSPFSFSHFQQNWIFFYIKLLFLSHFGSTSGNL